MRTEYSDYPCPKCKKKHVRAVFTWDIDYVKCTSCDFAQELKDWNISTEKK